MVLIRSISGILQLMAVYDMHLTDLIHTLLHIYSPLLLLDSLLQLGMYDQLIIHLAHKNW